MHVKENVNSTHDNEQPNAVNNNTEFEINADLPKLCPTLIDDMGQLFSILSIEKAIIVAKQKWPQFRFIHCSEYDMYEKEPYRTFNGFSFFLIAATLGCASLTYQPNKSVGLIISEHEPD